MSSSDPTEVLTPEEMAEADRLAIAAGTSGVEVMRRAGLAVAEAAQHVRPDGPILVVAGPGNNGGDGFVGASELRRRGRDVRVALLGERSRLAGDAATAAHQYDGPLITLGPETDLSAGLVIDALFGAGLSRPLEGLAATTVDR